MKRPATQSPSRPTTIALLVALAGIVGLGAAAIAQTPDFAENNAAQWGTFASDAKPASVINSTLKLKSGAASILFTTASGFDTGVRYPAAANLNLNASGYNTLVFWEYPENTTPIGWQGNQPIIVLKTGVGSPTPGTIKLEPTAQITPNFAWKLFKAPLAGGPGWTRTTTGTPNLADVDQIEIHHDTWDAGFKIWFDGVRFMNLDPNALPPPGPPPPPGVDPDVIEARVLLFVYDPIMTNFGNKRMHEVYGWGDPFELTDQILADFELSSKGRAKYKLAAAAISSGFPYLESGFQYTPESFHQAWTSGNLEPGTFDYTRFISDYNLGEQIDAGEFDEVWVYAFPGAGMWESAMAGKGAYWINGGAYPNAGGERAFVVMGWNFERGVGEAIHSYGHRSEAIMAKHYGPWLPNQSNMWNRFTLLDKDIPGKGGVGNVHYPVNADSDYDYANPKVVLSNADAWLDYPNLNDDTRPMNYTEWSPQGADPQREYLNWWYFHMPSVPSRGPDYYLANWWRYLIDVEQFKNGNANLYLTIGEPSVAVTSPAPGEVVSGQVRVEAMAEVDGALGRVDFYIDGAYAESDYLSPYVYLWPTIGLTGQHTLQARAYELQNGTEGASSIINVSIRCPADCDWSGTLNIDDFVCFQTLYAIGDPSADCDGDGGLTIDDFICYQTLYAIGC